MDKSVTDHPNADEVFAYWESLSNWGRWGKDDRLGTLNLITPEVRAGAAGLIKTGEVVSLSQDLDPENPDPLGSGMGEIRRFMQIGEITYHAGHAVGADAVTEQVLIAAHGSNTHLDGLGHYSWKGKSYNGFPAADITSIGGSKDLSIHHASKGIISRGVLLDICALHGLEWLEPGYAIGPDELAEAERRQKVRVRAGDVLLVNTGNIARVHALGRAPVLPSGPPFPASAGLHASCLPFLKERDVATLGTDTVQDVQPSGYEGWELFRPIHAIGISSLGLWLIDNISLSELANSCQERKQWEFFFAMLPWRMVGVTSSATNAVAIF